MAFGETSEAGRKGRELKEPLVSPAVIGSLNTWSQGFPKTRNRKYNSFPHFPPLPPPSTPSSLHPLLQAGLPPNECLQAGEFSSCWECAEVTFRAKYHHLVKLTVVMEATEGIKVFVLKKRLQEQVWLRVGISKRVLHISRFIDSLFPKGYTFIRS